MKTLPKAKRPDFYEWLLTEEGKSCNDITNLAEQKYLTNRLFWAFDAGRNCIWDQFQAQKVDIDLLFRETVMRAQLAMPETSQDLQWFDEGLDYRNSDFQIRLYKYFDLGNLNSVRFRKSRQKQERQKRS